MGEHLHVSFVKGQEQLLQWGSEVGEDVAWTLRPPMHAVAADALEPCCMQVSPGFTPRAFGCPWSGLDSNASKHDTTGPQEASQTPGFAWLRLSVLSHLNCFRET